MNKEDLKQLINETIQEMHTEESLLMGLDNIITWASNAKRQLNNKNDPQIFYRLVKAINDKSSEIITFSAGRHDDDDIDEGYGAGDTKTDPKRAGNWKVHFPSEKDWKKNKKSLSKVFETSPSDPHEIEEVQIYKSIIMVVNKLLQLHRLPNYDEREEEKFHKALQQLVGKLTKLEMSEPEPPPTNV